MKRIENALETVMFMSRWLLAPFYFGLIGALIMLLLKFAQELIHIIPTVFSGSESDLVLGILTLVDMSLIANLLLIIIFSGYENFVSKIDVEGHVDRPEWMGKVDFTGLKIKLIGSIVAISGIELLRAFVNVDVLGDRQLAWKSGLHLTFVVSGVLFAWMDRIHVRSKGH